MRVTRIISALVALLLAATIPLLAPGTATASADRQAGAAKQGTAAQPAAAKATRDVTFKFRGQGRTYKFYGKVSPKGKNKAVKLLRANCKKCKYRVFKSTRTNNRSRYIFRGLKRTGWFTVKVPASNGYSTSFASKTIHVFIT